MKINELRQVTAWLEASNISRIELKSGDQIVRLVRAPQHKPGLAASQAVAPEAALTPEPTSRYTGIYADTIGIFFAGHPLLASNFFKPGDAIRKGDILGLLKIGDMYLPTTSQTEGLLVKRLVEDGAVVGYGSRLFDIDPA